MAITDYPVNHPMAVKHWSKELMKQALKQTYAYRFMGAGSSSLAQVKNEMKEEGDKVTIGLRMQLSGAGVSGDNTLEGNEEALTVYTDSLFIDQLRHAVRSAGKMSEQRVPFSVREEAKDGLRDWWADRFDTAFFNQLAGNTAQTDTRYTGNQACIAPTNVIMEATSTASLAAADKFGIHLIDYAIEYAKTTATYPFKPLMVDGKEMWVCFIHDYQLTDLKRNYSAGQWGDIQKAAIQGGQTTGNPIFNGALGVYNNTIIHSTSRLPTAGVANTRRAVFCGAQALGFAFGSGNSMGSKFSWEEEVFDYGNQLGVGAGSKFGMKKLQFNSVDFATITIPTYAAAHTS